jgi:hypothetical protein
MATAHSRIGFVRALVAAAALAGGFGRPVHADDASQPRQLVVRVNREAIAPLVDKPIDRTSPVEDVVLGTRVTGKARTTGLPSVEFVEDSERATFGIGLVGTTVARTTGRNGPAIILTRADTKFTARTKVRFVPGSGFVAQPAKIEVTTRTTNEGVGSRRGGLVGWIVRRRASREVAASRSQVEIIARQKAQRRIAAAFDEYIQARLARLNEMTNLGPAVAQLLGDRQPQIATRTTGDFVEIAISSEGAQPVELPASDQPAAPVQVWIRKSTMNGQLATVLKLFEPSEAGTNVAERALASVPTVLKDTLGVPRDAAHAKPPMNYQTAADWIVVQIGGEAITGDTPVTAGDVPRLWTSADGRFSCLAVRLSASPDSVTLKRMDDGKVVTVPLTKLSETDRQVALR